MSSDRKNRVSQKAPRSPFQHASKFDIDQFPSSFKNDTQRRGPPRSGSLAAAYHIASKQNMPFTAKDLSPQATTPSPRQKRHSMNAFTSTSPNSPPPDEIMDSYRQIEEDGTLAKFVREDSWGSRARSPGRLSRSSSRAQEASRAFGSPEGNSISGASLNGDLGAYRPPRARDYTEDEKRLNRVTKKGSPVFSRAHMGRSPSLTADNLQRREQEELEVEQHIVEDDAGRGPSLNLPSSWGSRANYPHDWQRKTSQPSVSEKKEETRPSNRYSAPTTNGERDPIARPARTSPRSPVRNGLPARGVLEERTANSHNQAPKEDLAWKQPPSKPVFPTGDGNSIPNSPVTVFKSDTAYEGSKFTRPSPSKRGSRDLLRRLSRVETPKPDHMKTPQPSNFFGGKIYDQTPRVTGAWIDTPVTERVADRVPELPEDLTRDIVPPRAASESKTVTPPVKSAETATSTPEETKPIESKQEEPLPESKSEKQSRAPLPRPHLPKSALETVIEDASSGKDDEFGNDTLESLRGMMDDEDGPAELKVEEEDEEAYEKAVLEKLARSDSAQKGQVDLGSVNDKLNSLMRHISEVKKGLDGLEGQVNRATTISKSSSTPEKSSKQPSHIHTDETCKDCGTHSDGRVYAALPVPRLWKRDPTSGRLQMTKLGWFTLISLSWYILECLMCEHFSRPEITDKCEGYCLRPDAPSFPLVTVTMLWRWSHLSTLLTPIFAICVFVFRLFTQLLGFSDGYVEETPQLAGLVGEIRINGTPVAFPWLSAPTAQAVAHEPKQSIEHVRPVQPVQSVWPPRDAYQQQRWEEDQASMDDDEVL
ncbi:hypothetical protein PENANT_c002G04699 [Penicillium antarcticum]|uniref:Uncharacterized protein n=1 Tax=Penicillium antarcticum TaxID=416450 RepID=A0A1V6QKX8_9EURO|nr:uncharacterized protein N7508_008691 [Penicillium antarcticum]KAJ5293870.1 hypothetical protein N7508_008691 [Penicillium antarcticum]OQD89845.1 hypothetical protein PENANT_c002G04699 [Penicillium antarcticum]